MKRRDQIAHKILQRSHLEDRGYRDPETGEKSLCRIWDGPTSGSEDKTRGHGYGRMNLDGATVAVHIAAWVNENGLIPPRKQLDHLCHQRDCCEERHLKLRTHKQNQKNKKPKDGVHGQVGPTGRRGTPIREVPFKLGHEVNTFVEADEVTRSGIVNMDLSKLEERVVAHMVLGDMPKYGEVRTGRFSSGVIIDHDIPADRLPPPSPMVDDE